MTMQHGRDNDNDEDISGIIVSSSTLSSVPTPLETISTGSNGIQLSPSRIAPSPAAAAAASAALHASPSFNHNNITINNRNTAKTAAVLAPTINSKQADLKKKRRLPLQKAAVPELDQQSSNLAHTTATIVTAHKSPPLQQQQQTQSKNKFASSLSTSPSFTNGNIEDKSKEKNNRTTQTKDHQNYKHSSSNRRTHESSGNLETRDDAIPFATLTNASNITSNTNYSTTATIVDREQQHQTQVMKDMETRYDKMMKDMEERMTRKITEMEQVMADQLGLMNETLENIYYMMEDQQAATSTTMHQRGSTTFSDQ